MSVLCGRKTSVFGIGPVSYEITTVRTISSEFGGSLVSRVDLSKVNPGITV